MEIWDYFIDFHKTKDRQGPGSEESTLKALNYIPPLTEKSRILDIGCGSGGQTITLAQNTKAEITAVDMTPEFLETLQEKALRHKLHHRISTVQTDMNELDFAENSYDLIWSEGAIYIIGFEKGLTDWRKFLKEDGFIAVSEISWITEERPQEIEAFWTEAYPEIDTVDEKLKTIEKAGYKSLGHFILPESDWMNNYYRPLRLSSKDFLIKHRYAEEVKQMLDLTENEIKMYERYKEYYSYVFYIAQKK